MKKRLAFALSLALLLLTFCSCRRSDSLSSRLGIDLSQGQLLSSEDNHGGFHGDGSSLLCFYFPSKLEEALSDLDTVDGCSPLPLPKALQQAAYGDEGHSSLILSDEKIPPVKQGFYWFQDRHSQSVDPVDPTELWNRASFNFSLAIYDSQTHILFYYELDT